MCPVWESNGQVHGITLNPLSNTGQGYKNSYKDTGLVIGNISVIILNVVLEKSMSQCR